MCNNAGTLEATENHNTFTTSADATQPKRYKAFCVSSEVLQDILTAHKLVHFICEKGIPVGAKFIYAYINYYSFSQAIHLVFEHESFDEVPPGNEIPCDAPQMKQIYSEG